MYVLVSFINHEDMNHLKVRHMFSYKKDVPRPRKHFLRLFFYQIKVTFLLQGTYVCYVRHMYSVVSFESFRKQFKSKVGLGAENLFKRTFDERTLDQRTFSKGPFPKDLLNQRTFGQKNL